MPATTLEAARAAIDGLMDSYRSIDDDGSSVLGTSLTSGKVYEAWAVCEVLRRLRDEEGYHATLRRSTKLAFKSAPGPINRDFPHFRLTKHKHSAIELWTDVEFLSMSHAHRGSAEPVGRGDRHELDVLVVPAGLHGRPSHRQVLIGVECKNTGYTKDLLRSILGVRRELSLLSPGTNTRFAHWPRVEVPAEPPSCLLVYSSDPTIGEYAAPGETFGIDFVHLPSP